MADARIFYQQDCDLQYLAGKTVDCNTAALDVNGDGLVNNRDLTRLAQHLAGKTVDLH